MEDYFSYTKKNPQKSKISRVEKIREHRCIDDITPYLFSDAESKVSNQ
jgi:hypothetical protein